MKKLLLGIVVFLSACSVQVDHYDGFRGEVVLVQITKSEFESMLEETAVIILADPESPWSQEAVPVFNDAVKAASTQAYYYNATGERDNEELLSMIQAASFTSPIAKALYDELYLPIVIRVQNGQVREVHLGTVASHVITNDEIPALTLTQRLELQEIYQALLEQTS